MKMTAEEFRATGYGAQSAWLRSLPVETPTVVPAHWIGEGGLIKAGRSIQGNARRIGLIVRFRIVDGELIVMREP